MTYTITYQDGVFKYEGLPIQDQEWARRKCYCSGDYFPCADMEEAEEEIKNYKPADSAVFQVELSGRWKKRLTDCWCKGLEYCDPIMLFIEEPKEKLDPFFVMGPKHTPLADRLERLGDKIHSKFNDRKDYPVITQGEKEPNYVKEQRTSEEIERQTLLDKFAMPFFRSGFELALLEVEKFNIERNITDEVLNQHFQQLRINKRKFNWFFFAKEMKFNEGVEEQESQEAVWQEVFDFLIVHKKDQEYLRSKFDITRRKHK